MAEKQLLLEVARSQVQTANRYKLQGLGADGCLVAGSFAIGEYRRVE
jgi:hypothetical protein